MSFVMRIGIDLGGTKIEAAAMEPAGSLSLARRMPTPAVDYDETISAIVQLTAGLEAEIGGGARVGIGMPGAISPATGLVKNSNSTCLNGRLFHADIERALNRPVRLGNDANCFALSEAVDGAGKDARIVFGIILGTGVGGGIVVDGKLLVGANAISGEWGHNPLPWPTDDERPGPRCYCGRDGCIEAFLSGPSLQHDHFRATGENIEPGLIVAQAAAGDPGAENTLRRYEDRLARALAGAINLLDPDVIVVGGGLSQIARLYENVPRIWNSARYVFSDRIDTRLVPPKYGDSSGVRGAAWLWEAD
jgi:fructokinase